MYEKNSGSERLATALRMEWDNPESIRQLAEILHYNQRQLQQDIQAIYNKVYEGRGEWNPQ